jgi:hypothetical protein
MPDVYYHCHNCGSLHEVEAIRLNLHLAGIPVGDPWFPRRSLLGWLEHRRLTALLMRGLWPAPAAPPAPWHAGGRRAARIALRMVITVGLLAWVAARSGMRGAGHAVASRANRAAASADQS